MGREVEKRGETTPNYFYIINLFKFIFVTWTVKGRKGERGNNSVTSMLVDPLHYRDGKRNRKK